MPGRTEGEQIETEFEGRLDYAKYLELDTLLNAQHPLSKPAYHDESLFIIQHQTSELWMKLIIHELTYAIQQLRNDDLGPCFKSLARVKQIQRMLFEQWAVLETMTPSEFMEFRSFLGTASGLQSYQFRIIEFLLGNKDAKLLGVFKHLPVVKAELEDTLHKPGIYDEFLRYLGRHGYAVPKDRLERDWSKNAESSEGVIEVLKEVYQHPQNHWSAYEMAEKLIDVEQYFTLWRIRHLQTVERIIGGRKGTGGSSGILFLRAGLDVRLFPELWEVRTAI